MSYEYVREYYGVPAEIGRRVEYRGRGGIIYKEGFNYVAINFDDMKPGKTLHIHPTDPSLEYLGMGVLRKMTRSQKRYQSYIDSDSDCSFAEFLGIYN
ncbi:hypothetical protein LCGC14_2415450 [marine sediment metagenome]|uniref:Uncharacterized protein n=1 Tax=marine sediment metagenome TaxID=412755 RepID=A0A0F9BR97_9ZZZZ